MENSSIHQNVAITAFPQVSIKKRSVGRRTNWSKVFIAERLEEDRDRKGALELHMKRILRPHMSVIVLEEENLKELGRGRF